MACDISRFEDSLDISLIRTRESRDILGGREGLCPLLLHRFGSKRGEEGMISHVSPRESEREMKWEEIEKEQENEGDVENHYPLRHSQSHSSYCIFDPPSSPLFLTCLLDGTSIACCRLTVSNPRLASMDRLNLMDPVPLIEVSS